MDIEFVRKLCAALNRDPWVDWEDIPASTEWLSQIYAGIEGSDNFVFVISPDSVASEICQREVTHASRPRKCLIPILCRDVSDNRIQEVLARIQRIDFRDPDAFESALHRLIDALDCDPDWKQTHTRLLVRAREWEAKNRDESFLLRGMDLQDAVTWLAQAPLIERQPPCELHQEFITASKEREAAEVQRWKSLYNQAVARQLAAEAELILRSRPQALDLAMLLGLESLHRLPSLQATQILRVGLTLFPRPLSPYGVVRHAGAIRDLCLTSDGHLIATGSEDGTARVWETRDGP